MNIFYKIQLAIVGLLFPFISSAQTIDGTNVTSLARSINSFINRGIIPLFVALALMYTMYAIVDFILMGSDSQKKAEKKQKIFWGIIGLFVIVSIWGLVAVIGNTFGIFAGGTLEVTN